MDDWDTIPIESTLGEDSLRRVRSSLEFWRGKDHRGRFLFVLDGRSPTIEVPEKKPAGLDIEIIEKGQHKKRLIITLIDQDATDVFRALCMDLLRTADNLQASELDDGMTIVLRRIIRWQELLNARKSDLLSFSKMLGIIGEIHFLQEIIIPRLGYTVNALSSWRGPFGDEQDFLYNGIIYEVKTQLATSDRYIQISSEDQLDTVSGTIILCHQSFSKSHDEGTPKTFSLGSLVNDLHQQLMLSNTSAADLFVLALIELGYEDRPEYFRDIYKFHARNFYYVGEDFPRIVRKSVPLGIDKVTYRISIDACSEFKINEDSVFKGVAGHGEN